MRTIYNIKAELELKIIPHVLKIHDRCICIPDSKNCEIFIKETPRVNVFFVEYLNNWKGELPYNEVIPQVIAAYKHYINEKEDSSCTDTQEKIAAVLDSMKDLILYKNQKYGDSAINPKKIFYKGDSTNSILIRLDDKLGRVIANTEEMPRVNDVADIIGYCTLLLISMGVKPEDIAKFKD